MNKEKVPHICKFCELYHPQEKVCDITIILEGEYMELETEPNDHCHWERVNEEMGINIFEQVKKSPKFKIK